MKNNDNGNIQLIVIGAVLVVAVGAFFLYSNTQKAPKTTSEEKMMTEDKMMEEEMIHGIVISVDGENYYFDGPADGEEGEKDIPGHMK
jgi:hypothetical protein